MTHDHELKLQDGWSGKVTMTIPKHHERLLALSEYGVTSLKKQEDKAKQFDEYTPVLIRLYMEKVRPLIKSVQITGPEGEKIDNLDAMETHPACEFSCIDLASKYLAGFGPGKPKSSS